LADGLEVIVNPPAFGMPGTKTSSHWPGRNFTDARCGYFEVIRRDLTYPYSLILILDRELVEPDIAVDFFYVAQDYRVDV
jgi:hypothetical protein